MRRSAPRHIRMKNPHVPPQRLACRGGVASRHAPPRPIRLQFVGRTNPCTPTQSPVLSKITTAELGSACRMATRTPTSMMGLLLLRVLGATKKTTVFVNGTTVANIIEVGGWGLATDLFRGIP